MDLDIRIPIGLLFLVVGGLLTFYGLLTFSDAKMYTASLNVNINLYWGVAMLAFGTIMTILGRSKKKAAAAKVEPH